MFLAFGSDKILEVVKGAISADCGLSLCVFDGLVVAVHFTLGFCDDFVINSLEECISVVDAGEVISHGVPLEGQPLAYVGRVGDCGAVVFELGLEDADVGGVTA